MMMMPQKDPALMRDQLTDPTYYAQQLALYQSDPLRWAWYLRTHAHKCKACGREITHTGLEAERDGDAVHLCCGRDVRL